MTEPRALFGLVLIGVQASLAIPIIVTLLGSRRRWGISLPGELIWVAAGAGWALYGAMTGSVTLIISGSIAALTSGTISILVWSAVPSQRCTALLLGTGTAIILGASALFAAEHGLSISLAAVGVLQFGPQFAESLRAARSGASTPGVSVLGASLRSLYTFGWALYGGAWFLWGASMLRIEWALVAWGLAGTITFALQALVASRIQPRA